MKECLADFRKDLPWVERLDMTNLPAEDVLSKLEGQVLGESNGDATVDDDFQREMFLWVVSCWPVVQNCAFILEVPFLWLKWSGLILIVLFAFKATVKLRRQSYRHFLCWISMAYPPRGLTITLQRWPNQTSTCRRWEPSFRKEILTGLLENTISQLQNPFFSPDQEKTDLKADDNGEVWEGQETTGAKEIW